MSRRILNKWKLKSENSRERCRGEFASRAKKVALKRWFLGCISSEIL